MHRFVVNIGSMTPVERARLETLAKDNRVEYDNQQWLTADRKRAAIFAFALVGLGAAFSYHHQQKEESSDQESSEVPRSS